MSGPLENLSPKPLTWDEQRLAAPHAQEDKAERVRWMFNAIAPTYELVNSLASLGQDRRWRRGMVRLAKVRPDDMLIDVACGTGDVVRAFAASDPRPRRIAGLDFAAGMLKRAAARSLGGGSFCQADALHLPVMDASASIVTCAFGIRNFQDLGAGLREMHRVLCEGGRAVILEFTVPEQSILRALYLFYFKRIMPLVATLISRDRSGAYRYLPASVLSFQSRGGIVAALKSAGFAQVDVYPLTFGIVAVYVAHKKG